jgi:hypothetical protein
MRGITRAGWPRIHDELLAKLKADQRRTRTEPPQAEIEASNAAFKPIVDGWLAKDPRNARVFHAVKAEVAKLRAGA